MALQLLPDPDYSGMEGVKQVRFLQQELAAALRTRDWVKLRRLDECCSLVVEKVVAANTDSSDSLIDALNELKSVYATLIENCRQEAAAVAV